jgi:nucleoside-diphosphate-sugar epimerase
MKNVLVTGGTGFIGVELVRHLAEAGLRPRLLVRRPHRAALLASLDVDLVAGDLATPRNLERAVDGVDTVFHLGGRASFESYRRLKPTIVDGTLRLASAAAAAGVEHFVFASSLFVYGDQDRPITAATPAGPRMAYGRAKLESEAGLARISSATGMTVANLRFPHVYGPQSILFDQVRSGLAIFPGGMSNRCGQLHVEDAARILMAVGESRWTGTSPVADDDSVTWTEYFDVLGSLYPQYRLITLPRWFGYAGAVVLEPILSRRSRPTLYTKDTVVGFNLNVPVAPRLVWDDLGLEPRYPTIASGIPAVLDGYLRFRWRHPLLDHRRS